MWNGLFFSACLFQNSLCLSDIRGQYRGQMAIYGLVFRYTCSEMVMYVVVRSFCVDMKKINFYSKCKNLFVVSAFALVASCGNDDVVPAPPPSNVPLLKSATWNGGKSVYQYDEKSRVVSVVSHDNISESRTISYRYDDTRQRIYSEMKEERRGDFTPVLLYRDTIFLKNGLADSVSGVILNHTVYHFRMHYDVDRHLVKVNVRNVFIANRNELKSVHEYVWEGDNLKTYMTAGRLRDLFRIDYSYTFQPAVRHSVMTMPNANLQPLLCQGYLGMLPKYLVEKEQVSEGGSQYSCMFSYVLKEGLVMESAMTYGSREGFSRTIYGWE